MQDVFSNFDFTQGLLNLYNPQGAERRRKRLEEEKKQTERQARVAQMLETLGASGLDERQQLKKDAGQLSDLITAAPIVSDTPDTSEGDALRLHAITGPELDTLRSFDKEKENIESGQDRSGNMFNMTDENVGQMRDILKGLPASDAIDVVRGALSTSLSERIKDQFKEKEEKEIKQFRYFTNEEKRKLGIPEYKIGGSYASDPNKFIEITEMEKGQLPKQPNMTEKINTLVTKYPNAFPIVTDKKGNSRMSINFDKIKSKEDKAFARTLFLLENFNKFNPNSSSLVDMIEAR